MNGAGCAHAKTVYFSDATRNLNIFKLREDWLGKLFFARRRNAASSTLFVKNTFRIIATFIIYELETCTCTECVTIWITGNGTVYGGFTCAILSYLTGLPYTEFINLACFTVLSGKFMLVAGATSTRAGEEKATEHDQA
jgi:hypothetical protein